MDNNKIICGYGCGREAKYPPRKGLSKWCCEYSFVKCPKVIEKNAKNKKDKTWEELYGKEKSEQRKKKTSKKMSNTMKGRDPWNKGKTNVYNEEALKGMRENKNNHIRGKTYEEVYGKEKAKELKNNKSKLISERNRRNIPWNKGKKDCFNEDTITKMKNSQLKLWNDERRKEYSEIFKIKFEEYEQKYPIFCSLEEFRKNNDGEIEVRCKYCNSWFVPSSDQLGNRIRATDGKNGNMKSFIYCCKEHQYLCPESGRNDPNTYTQYQKYVKNVLIETEKNVKKFSHYIPNIELRGNRFGYHLDHKYSIRQGFEDNIDPEIIGHYKNIEIIKAEYNISKGKSCSITIQYLLQEINNKR